MSFEWGERERPRRDKRHAERERGRDEMRRWLARASPLVKMAERRHTGVWARGHEGEEGERGEESRSHV